MVSEEVAFSWAVGYDETSCAPARETSSLNNEVFESPVCAQRYKEYASIPESLLRQRRRLEY
jgi:hypothetical protein